MSAITMEPIGTTRYAPVGSNVVYLYSVNGCSELSLERTIMSVCLKRAAQDESMSVTTMNKMNSTARKMAATANVLEQVLDENSSWDTIIDIADSGYIPTKVSETATLKEFLEIEIGCEGLPASIDSYIDKTTASEKVKTKVDELNRASEEDSIDLESTISRRDVEYRTSASMVYSLGQCATKAAQNLL